MQFVGRRHRIAPPRVLAVQVDRLVETVRAIQGLRTVGLDDAVYRNLHLALTKLVLQLEEFPDMGLVLEHLDVELRRRLVLVSLEIGETENP